MGIELKCDFTSHSMFPEHESEPNENLALGKYSAVIDALELYVQKNNLILQDREKSNVYADMCTRRIAFFAYGFDHQLTLTTAAGKKLGTLTARVEAFDYRDYSKYGNVKLFVGGDNSLTEAVNLAWELAEPLSEEKLHQIRGKFAEGKQKCYGYCRRS